MGLVACPAIIVSTKVVALCDVVGGIAEIQGMQRQALAANRRQMELAAVARTRAKALEDGLRERVRHREQCNALLQTENDKLAVEAVAMEDRLCNLRDRMRAMAGQHRRDLDKLQDELALHAAMSEATEVEQPVDIHAPHQQEETVHVPKDTPEERIAQQIGKGFCGGDSGDSPASSEQEAAFGRTRGREGGGGYGELPGSAADGRGPCPPRGPHPAQMQPHLKAGAKKKRGALEIGRTVLEAEKFQSVTEYNVRKAEAKNGAEKLLLTTRAARKDEMNVCAKDGSTRMTSAGSEPHPGTNVNECTKDDLTSEASDDDSDRDSAILANKSDLERRLQEAMQKGMKDLMASA